VSLLATIGVLTYVAIAAAWDLKSRRIPNWLSGTALVGALVIATRPGGVGLPAAGLGGLLGLAALIVPFTLGAVGGGDVKFATVAGTWLGPRLGLVALLIGIAIGLFTALGTAAAAGRLGEAVVRAARLVWLLAATLSLSTLPPASEAEGRLAPIPYAVPLAAGVAGAVLLDHQGWRLI
jgi:prepilin peptidase CpaA